MLVKNQKGASTIEYALLVALLAIGLTSGIDSLKTNVSATFRIASSAGVNGGGTLSSGEFGAVAGASAGGASIGLD